MKIRSVAILGAGAVGSYLLWGLTDKPGGAADGIQPEKIVKKSEKRC